MYRELQPTEEELGILHGRFGQYDGELVTSDATRNVGSTHDQPQPLCHLSEHRVASQMPYVLVDGFEVIEVEEDQGETAVVAMRALDLMVERVVEVAAIVEPGKGISHRELMQLLELASVLDCFPSRKGQLLERGKIVLFQLFFPPDGQNTASVPVGEPSSADRGSNTPS